MSPLLIYLLPSIAKIIGELVILLTCVAYTVLLARNAVRRIQNRLGPSRL